MIHSDSAELSSGRSVIGGRDSGELTVSLTSAPFGLGVLDVDGTWLLANDKLCGIIGHPQEWLLSGKSIFDLVSENDRSRLLQILQSVAAAGDRPESLTARAIHANGHVAWVEFLIWNTSSDDLRRSFSCQVREVSDQLEVSERNRMAVEHSAVGMAVMSPGGLLLDVNPAFADLVGIDQPDLIGRSLGDVSHPDDQVLVAQQSQSALEASLSGFRYEQRFFGANGATIWADVTGSLVFRADGLPLYFVLGIQDVTERRQAEERLRQQAFLDPLTGLANRILLQDRLEQCCARSARSGKGYALLFCDLDRFKGINDSLGHNLGDKFLARIAGRLLSEVRPTDTVARVGGDEFVIVCEDMEYPEDALRLAQRVRRAIDRPIHIENHRLQVTVSVGIMAVSGGEASRHTPSSLLRDADTALYEAKRNGTARIEVFTEELRQATVRRHQLESDLHRAVERGEFELHYQPVVDLITDDVIGFESLLRWNHPERGLLPPGDFVPIAEENPALTIRIGEWVAEEAIAQAAELREIMERPVWVAINVSGHQLGEPAFASTIARLLMTHQLPHDAIHLELTESVLIDGDSMAFDDLAQCQELGVKLAIDDFGTGWSSLRYLQQLPVDFLKIDRAFTSGVLHGENEIVDAIVQLGRAMELGVIAEGIENEEQAKRLISLGCTLGQGYHFGVPTPYPGPT